MQELLPAVLATLRDSEDEVATAVVPFLNSWVARLKANQKRTGGVPQVSLYAVHFPYVYLVMIGILYKATPIVASVKVKVLLRLRPTPWGGIGSCNAMQYILLTSSEENAIQECSNLVNRHVLWMHMHGLIATWSAGDQCTYTTKSQQSAHTLHVCALCCDVYDMWVL